MVDTEVAEVVLLHAFESPKKDWTLITFGFETDGNVERGYKPLDMWYNRKGILSQLDFSKFGRKVKAKFIYENDRRNPNQMTRKVSEFELDNVTYKLV